jgi:hypothetical protein
MRQKNWRILSYDPTLYVALEAVLSRKDQLAVKERNQNLAVQCITGHMHISLGNKKVLPAKGR